SLGDPERVAGFVAPGSTVAIFVSGTGTTTTGSQAALPSVKLLLQNITVLAVGPTTLVNSSTGQSTASNQQITAAILTLAVTQDEAQKIIYATGAPGGGYKGLYFALMDPTTKLVIGGTGANATNLFTPGR
ncbi:MAG TPA: RcpC/CpaB family pilus assembly protein, partial [Candidatus Nanopelagicales bacterium]|nr:RcpC/CpaB family pilus assembly protein [Candidatus Nanopelagicales bacterium]